MAHYLSVQKIIDPKEVLQTKAVNNIGTEDFEIYGKKEASLLHFSEIEKSDVDALLIVNETKNNQENSVENIMQKFIGQYYADVIDQHCHHCYDLQSQFIQRDFCFLWHRIHLLLCIF